MSMNYRCYNYVRQAFFFSIGVFILTNVILLMMPILFPKLYGSLEIHFLPLGLLLVISILMSEYFFALACAVFYAIQEFELSKTIALLALFFFMLVWSAAFLPGLPQAPTFSEGEPVVQKIAVNGRPHYIITYSVFRRSVDNFLNSNGYHSSNQGNEVYLCECDPFMFLCNVIKQGMSIEAVMN